LFQLATPLIPTKVYDHNVTNRLKPGEIDSGVRGRPTKAGLQRKEALKESTRV